MGVPSFVYGDLPEEEKQRLFERDMKHRLWAVILGIVLVPVIIIIGKYLGWE